MSGIQASVKKAILILSSTLLGIGFLSRILPLFDFGGRVFRQFPTEDGYLMLTIARNLALGHGMSTSEGEIPTNGTQPLFNIIEAGVFWLLDGERFSSVLLIQIIQVLLSVWAAYLLFRLTHSLLVRSFGEKATPVALLTASLWFASPFNVPNTMNCLETGLYQTLHILSVLLWFKFIQGRDTPNPFGRAALLGGLLGLTFLARIDAVYLIACLTAWNVIPAVVARAQVLPRLIESTIMGVTSIAVGSPWLIFNYTNFGSLMPISGTAQGADTSGIGGNFFMIPATLFELEVPFLLIPEGPSNNLLVQAFCLLFTAAALYFFITHFVRKQPPHERLVWNAVACLAACHTIYYGVFFGASHFVPRYLSPLATWGAMMSSILLVLALEHLSRVRQLGLYVGLPAIALLVLGLNVRTFWGGAKHQHFQVVEWIQEHVPEETWIAAIQTGTIGFFHDRTVNLDGKVNPDALEARLGSGTGTFEYVINESFGAGKGKIQYLADWETIAIWEGKDPLQQHFDLIVNDPKQRLAVFKRKSAP